MRELLSLLRRMDVQGLFRRPTTNAMVQFFRYAFVGGFAAVVDWAVVWLVERLGAHYQVGVVCGFFRRADGQLPAFQVARVSGGKGRARARAASFWATRSSARWACF